MDEVRYTPCGHMDPLRIATIICFHMIKNKANSYSYIIKFYNPRSYRVNVLVLPLSKANLYGNLNFFKDDEVFMQLKTSKFSILMVESNSHMNNCSNWLKETEYEPITVK